MKFLFILFSYRIFISILRRLQITIVLSGSLKQRWRSVTSHAVTSHFLVAFEFNSSRMTFPFSLMIRSWLLNHRVDSRLHLSFPNLPLWRGNTSHFSMYSSHESQCRVRKKKNKKDQSFPSIPSQCPLEHVCSHLHSLQNYLTSADYMNSRPRNFTAYKYITRLS